MSAKYNSKSTRFITVKHGAHNETHLFIKNIYTALRQKLNAMKQKSSLDEHKNKYNSETLQH